MKNLKEDRIYIIVGIIFVLFSLVLISITFSGENYVLQLPMPSNLYALVTWIVTIVFGILGIFLFRNVDRKNIDLSKVFLLIAIPIGILYCIVNPLGRVPDEEYHIRKAMAISNVNFFSYANEEGKAFDMMNAKVSELVTRSSDSYEEALRRINLEETNENVELEYTTMALYAPICHLPQSIGIFITRLFKASIPVQCYASRLVNFAVAVFLIYKSIKLIPFKKHVVLFLALLPITLEEIASSSSDCLAISICMFYISYILYLKYNSNVERISKNNIAILAITSIIVALCKIVYIPLVFLLFILPKEKFESLKKKNIIVILITFFAIILNLVWLAYCSRFLTTFNPGVDSKEQVMFVLTHPISYIFILFRTISMYFQIHIVSLCGEGLGLYNVQTSTVFILPCIIFFATMFIVNDEKEIEIDLITKIISAMIFIAIVVLVYTSLYVQWTSVRNPIVIGVQARYFLPVLLLTALVLHNNIIVFNKKLSKRYLSMFMLFLNLNALSMIYFTYITGTIINYYIK